MSVYEELDPMIEHRKQFAFNGKREHIAKDNISNMVYPGQHIDFKIWHGSRDHVIIPDSVKVTFKLNITSTERACSL